MVGVRVVFFPFWVCRWCCRCADSTVRQEMGQRGAEREREREREMMRGFLERERGQQRRSRSGWVHGAAVLSAASELTRKASFLWKYADSNNRRPDCIPLPFRKRKRAGNREREREFFVSLPAEYLERGLGFPDEKMWQDIFPAADRLMNETRKLLSLHRRHGPIIRRLTSRTAAHM